MKLKKRIVLAYSGGLDTSIILKWLQENYNSEVICYTADVGQEIDRKKILRNAKKFGVKNIIIQDLKDEFVKNYVYPMIEDMQFMKEYICWVPQLLDHLLQKIKLELQKNLKLLLFLTGQLAKEMIK